MTISAGELNCKITFQVPTKGSAGYSAKTWSDDFRKWAKIATSAGGEVEQSGKQVVEVTHIITCRYSDKITTDHRISYKGSYFEIVGLPQNSGYTNAVCLLNCKEITNA